MDYSVNALVLRSLPVGDYDKSLTLLAEGEGPIRCWAKAAGRIKSPLLAASAVFTYGRYTLNKRGERVTVGQAEVVESFFDLRKDIGALAAAGFVAELCSALTVEGQADDALLRLTLNALYALSRGVAGCDAILGAYAFRALSEAGYMPHLEGCVRCGGRDEVYAFSPLDGGLVCRRCAPAAKPLPGAAVDAMRYITTCEDKKLYMFKTEGGLDGQLAALAAEYAQNQLARPFETFSFYQTIHLPQERQKT
ncbi:MAG TPA: DNA repair protein RecO [Candidatus Acidoferrum sp.]|nr:DNA repair protein RecO [Candidatus Acidoferrum sp.]